MSDVGLNNPGNISLETFVNLETEKQLAEQYYSSLNSAQKEIVDAIINAAEFPDEESLFFVDGPGGCGKTHVYNTVIHKLRADEKQVIAVAWTGIAAILLPSGRTVHSRFKFPVPLVENSTSSMRPNSVEGSALRSAAVIIWDEASMAPKYALDTLDKLLRDVTRSNRPFGGKVLVLGGDFRQVLPVVPRASTASIIETSIKQSMFWPMFSIYKLTENMRAQNDVLFSEWLLKLGDNVLPKLHNISESTIEIPEQVICSNVVDEIYGDEINISDVGDFANCAIICPLNEDCFSINEVVLRKINSPVFEYVSFDKVISEEDIDSNIFPIEFLHSLTPTGMPQHILKLKEGAVIMLLRNLNPRRGLCNGTRLFVMKCHPNTIVASILTGDNRGDVVFIPRITLSPSDTGLPFLLERRQFPVRLAFAMTINKSQGQTFSKIGIFLKKPVFSHGQLYVAFSRVQSFNDVKLQIINGDKQGITQTGNGYTTNIVHQEAL